MHPRQVLTQAMLRLEKLEARIRTLSEAHAAALARIEALENVPPTEAPPADSAEPVKRGPGRPRKEPTA